MESDDSEAEDLPSYSFVSSQPEKEETLNSTLSAAEVVANRLRNEEYFKKVESIRNSVQNLHSSDESNTDTLFEDDEDTKDFIKQAEKLKVQSTTLYYIPDYKFLNQEFCGCLFSHETLKLETFMGEKMKYLHERLKVKTVFEELVKSTGLQVTTYPKKVREKFCPYLFYLMSVHPDFNMTHGIYSYLILQNDYAPTVTDIINVLQNWGATLQDMLTTAPNYFKGLHPALVGCEPNSVILIESHNMLFLLKYLIFVLKTKGAAQYVDIVRPMLQFSINVDTYLSNIKISVCEIVQLLSNLKDYKYPLETVHLKEFSLKNQFFICSKSLACTILQSPLAYAALQQFLGEPEILYKIQVDLKSVFDLVTRKKEKVIGETFNETSYILKLIDIIVRRIVNTSEGVIVREYTNRWLSLLCDLSLEIQESDHLSDPVLLKDQIAQMTYDLRINLQGVHSVSVENFE